MGNLGSRVTRLERLVGPLDPQPTDLLITWERVIVTREEALAMAAEREPSRPRVESLVQLHIVVVELAGE